MILKHSYQFTRMKWTRTKLRNLLAYMEEYICQGERRWRYAFSGQNILSLLKKALEAKL